MSHITFPIEKVKKFLVLKKLTVEHVDQIIVLFQLFNKIQEICDSLENINVDAIHGNGSSLKTKASSFVDNVKKHEDILTEIECSVDIILSLYGMSFNSVKEFLFNKCNDRISCFDSYDMYEKNKFDANSNANGMICLSFIQQSEEVHSFTKKLWKNCESMKNELDCSYQFSWGNESSREVAVNFWNEFHFLKSKQAIAPMKPENLLLTNGANHGLFGILSSLQLIHRDKSPEVIVPIPFYSSHDKIVRQSKCISTFVLDSFFNPSFINKMDLSKTIAIIVTNPSNPLGKVMLNHEILEWVEWSLSHPDIFVIFDETLLCTSANSSCSVFNILKSSLPSNIIWISSLSKFGLESWRVGFIYTTNANLIQHLHNYLSVSPISHLSQTFIQKLLTSIDTLKMSEWIDLLQTNTALSINTVGSILESYRIPYIVPKAGLFILLDLTSLCNNFDDEYDLFEAIFLSPCNGVLLLRGEDCGFQIPGYYRLSISPDKTLMTAAIKSIFNTVKRWSEKIQNKNAITIKYWQEVFSKCWEYTDKKIFSYISNDLWYNKPIEYRHPFIFYMGHLCSFISNKLKQFIPSVYVEFNALFDEIFERGIDPDVNDNVCKHRHSWKNQLSWNQLSIDEIAKYQNNIRELLLNKMSSILMTERGETLLHVLLEHEYMHQETLQYMLIQVPIENLSNINSSDIKIKKLNKSQDWTFIPGNGRVKMGKSYSDKSFGWDNEFGYHEVAVRDLYIRSNNITNEEFLDFVLDDGYSNPTYWDLDTFQFIQSKQKHPVFWSITRDGSYKVRVNIDTEIDWEESKQYPVVVSWIEANAYCKWLSKKRNCVIELPSESEWIHSIRDTLQSNPNIWTGDYWEWTKTKFDAHQNYSLSSSNQSIYSTSLLYPEYSTDFWDNEHYVMLGKSYATTDSIIGSKSFSQRKTFRNWFQKKYLYMFASFRCISYDDPTRPTSVKLSNGVLSEKHKIADSIIEEIPVDKDFIWSGINQPTGQKHVPSYMFYDDIGSQIFAEIMHLPEYYLCRAEESLLKFHSIDIIDTIMSQVCQKQIKFIELGCGDGLKSLLWLEKVNLYFDSKNNLLEEVEETKAKIENSLYSYEYIPTDISNKAIQLLLNNSKKWSTSIQSNTKPLLGSHEQIFENFIQGNNEASNVLYNKVYIFLGSSLGNYTIEESKSFLLNLTKSMNHGDILWLGFDLIKTPQRLVPAYDDKQKVTAKFNFNLIKRLNELYNWNLKVESFEHLAFYNPKTNCMESWLMNNEKINLCYNNEIVEIKEFEGIHTEISMKYRVDDINQILLEITSTNDIGTYDLLNTWFDDKKDFCHAVWKYNKKF